MWKKIAYLYYLNVVFENQGRVSAGWKGFYLLLPVPLEAARNDKLGQNNGRNDVLCPGGVRKFGILQA